MDKTTMNAQIKRFRKGFPWLKIVAPAIPGNGIEVLDEAAQDAAVNTALGYTVPEGQVWSGAGSVSGTLNVASNGVVSAADGDLSVATLSLEPGAVLEASAGAGGSISSAVQAGDLTLPDGEVTLRVRGGSSASAGVVLRWTGTLRDNGATWKVVGAGGAAKVRMDVSAKTLKLSPASGTMLMIR